MTLREELGRILDGVRGRRPDNDAPTHRTAPPDPPAQDEFDSAHARLKATIPPPDDAD